MFKKFIIVCTVFVIIFMIPVTVAGAIASDPIGFIGEIIFGSGDTKEVTKDVETLYKQFIDGKIGSQTIEYISEQTKDRDKIYGNAHYLIPVLLIMDEKSTDQDASFDSLNIAELIDILIDLRYDQKNEIDDDYISAVKKDSHFSKLNELTNTTILTYINKLDGSGTIGEEIEVNGDSEIGNAIANSALSKRGCKYVWGTQGPNTFDCSGLVWWACNQNGIKFTRTTAAVLSRMGKSITKGQLQAGDIITFKTDPTYVSHVGIYIGNGKMVHAPNSRSVVRVDDVFGSSYWTSVIHNYRRLY